MIPKKKIEELQKLHTKYVLYSRLFDGGHGETHLLPEIWLLQSKMTQILSAYYPKESNKKRKKK
jgi:hypothetical protein